MNDERKLSITTASWARGVAVIALAYAAFLLKEIVLVVIASVVIATAIEPVVLWAKRNGIPRLPSVLFVYVGSAILVAGLFYFLLLPLIGEMSGFIRTLTIYSESVANDGILSNLFESQGTFAGLDTPMIIRELGNLLNYLTEFLQQGLFSSMSLIFGGVLSFVLIIVLSFYLVAQDDGISKFLRIITPIKHEAYVIRLWRRTQANIGLWMQSQIMASVVVTVLVYASLLVIGLPHALLLAVIAGLFELIPLFGSVLASIPALFVAYMWGGLPALVLVTVLYIVIQQIEGNIIYPLMVKKMVGLPPVIAILALVVGGTLAGFLGVLVSIPVATAIMEFFSDLEERKLTNVSEGTA